MKPNTPPSSSDGSFSAAMISRTLPKLLLLSARCWKRRRPSWKHGRQKRRPRSSSWRRPSNWSFLDEAHDLSTEEALRLVKGWHAAQNPFSGVEVTCSTQKTVVDGTCMFSCRCSVWNGGNLETPEGINRAKRTLDQFRPVRLWIACDCAPFCPLQRSNRKTPEQCRRLEEKQANAVKQYMEVADVAASLNISVRWELSEKNAKVGNSPKRATFLNGINFRKGNMPWVHGGLRTRDGKLALCKGRGLDDSNFQSRFPLTSKPPMPKEPPQRSL